jgi:chromate transporter
MILFSTSSVAQLGTILMGGIAGFWLCRAGAPNAAGSFGVPVSRRAGFMALTLFFSLLVALPVLAWRVPQWVYSVSSSPES